MLNRTPWCYFGAVAERKVKGRVGGLGHRWC
jgi:hypothetical protein